MFAGTRMLSVKTMNQELRTENYKFILSPKFFNFGFTLLELIIVIAILGILATFLIGNFTTSQKKARDAQRKSDLRQIQEALEMYLNDKGVYPAASSGKIIGCGTCGNLPSACNWDSQSEFRDTIPSGCGTTYMKKLPKDPLNNQNYYYWASTDQKSYKLYACLENVNDPRIITPSESVNCGGCNGSCNYGVASSNTTP